MKSKFDTTSKMIFIEPRVVVKGSIEGASKMDLIRAVGTKTDTPKTNKK